MKYQFNAYGHPNIRGAHKTTFELTKDAELSLRGDCIIGVNADFNLKEIKKFIEYSIKNDNKKIQITLKIGKKNKKIHETINAEINTYFNSDKEIVIRKTDFISERTFAIMANKSAFDLNRDLISFLKENKGKISITIKNKQ